jgi:hypothetical protein
MADRTGIPPRFLERFWLASEIAEVQASRAINPFWGFWQMAVATGLAASGNGDLLKYIMPAAETKIVGEDDDDETRMQNLRSLRENSPAGLFVRKPPSPETPNPVTS